MKLHSTQTLQYQTVTGYEDDWVEINAQRFAHSLVVLPESTPKPWKVDAFEDLQSSDFDILEARSCYFGYRKKAAICFSSFDCQSDVAKNRRGMYG